MAQKAKKERSAINEIDDLFIFTETAANHRSTPVAKERALPQVVIVQLQCVLIFRLQLAVYTGLAKGEEDGR